MALMKTAESPLTVTLEYDGSGTEDATSSEIDLTGSIMFEVQIDCDFHAAANGGVEVKVITSTVTGASYDDTGDDYVWARWEIPVSAGNQVRKSVPVAADAAFAQIYVKNLSTVNPSPVDVIVRTVKGAIT
tara:strand:+ start:1693 stop:2085 length:393 start_codon:yes stop_codon:yes gene_type:complete